MSDNAFMDPERCPDEEAVAAALGVAFPWYEAVCDAGDDYEQEWKFHGRKYGWKLKVHDYEKTLFELTVAEGRFRLGMAVRENELRLLRNDPELSAKLDGLLDADEAAGGWGIRLEVDDEAGFTRALLLVEAVAPLRL